MLVGLGRRRAGGEAADEGKHFDHHRAVVVHERREGAADEDGAPEFFVQFAGEGGVGEFAGLDLAAGKFPLEAEVFVGRPLGDQDKAGGVFEDGAGDGEGFVLISVQGADTATGGETTEAKSRRAAIFRI